MFEIGAKVQVLKRGLFFHARANQPYELYQRRLAIDGERDRQADFQIQCGPAMGAFNQFARGTRYEAWQHRHVDEIADLLMTGAASALELRSQQLATAPSGSG